MFGTPPYWADDDLEPESAADHRPDEASNPRRDSCGMVGARPPVVGCRGVTEHTFGSHFGSVSPPRKPVCAYLGGPQRRPRRQQRTRTRERSRALTQRRSARPFGSVRTTSCGTPPSLPYVQRGDHRSDGPVSACRAPQPACACRTTTSKRSRAVGADWPERPSGYAYNVATPCLERNDMQAAEAAFRRADERRSADGTHFLAMLLQHRGDVAGPRAAEQRAAERGYRDA